MINTTPSTLVCCSTVALDPVKGSRHCRRFSTADGVGGISSGSLCGPCWGYVILAGAMDISVNDLRQ